MNGVGRIAAERQSQVVVKGWTSDHDDEHNACEMAMAAVAYIGQAVGIENGVCWPDEEPAVPAEWPWHMDWWRPAPRAIRNLEKAGALIAAEIDRLLRKRDADIEQKLDDMGMV